MLHIHCFLKNAYFLPISKCSRYKSENGKISVACFVNTVVLYVVFLSHNN